MKCLFRASALLIFLTFIPMDAGLAVENPAPPGVAGQAGGPTPAMILAAQVDEIAHSRLMSHAKKEKRIATAVRVAVVGATAYKSPAETLNTASELAATAAHEAPQFKDVIVDAVSFIPSVARIDGASGQIRAAVYDAAATAGKTKIATTETHETPAPGKEPAVESAPVIAAVETPAASSSPEKAAAAESAEKTPAPPAAESTPRSEAAVSAVAAAGPVGAGGPPETGENPSRPEGSSHWGIPEIPLGDNASLHFTADLSGRYDDNIFLTRDGKVSDEIVSLAPGAEFQFGQNSLGHGSLTYQESFERYLRTNTANAQLGTGNADFGYDNGTLAAGATASFQQLNQNNRDVIIQGKKAIIRSDVLDLDGNVEPHLTAKTSVRVGGDYSQTKFRTVGLVDSSSTSLPVKIYYAATPKVDISTGVTYRDVKVKGATRDTRDLYYNVGARGDFTPKLNGEISMGYRTRSLGQSQNNSTFGFDGTLTYAATPNTNGTLVMSRDFSVGALGESLKNTSFSLGLSTTLSIQWQAGVNLRYQNVEYSTFRKDDYWEGGVSASYIYSSRISASAGYIFRNNNSTLSGVEFSDNILSLTLSFRS